MAKNKSGTNKPSGLSSEAAKVGKSLGLEASEIAQVQGEILKGSIRNTTELYNALRRINEQHVENTKQLQEQVDLQDAYLDLAQSLQRPLSKIGSLTKQQLSKDRELLENAKERGVIRQSEYDANKKILEQLEKMSDNKFIKQGFKAAANTIDQLQGSIKSFMGKLPGGDFLYESLGIDKLADNLEQSLIKGGNAGLAGMVVAVGALYAVLKSVTDEARKFSSETGLTFAQSRGIADAARQAQTSYSNQLSTQQDILDVQKETIKAFGTTAMLTADQAMNVADLGNSFGYGAQQAAGINNAFMTMGATADQAYQAQQSLAAESLKAGVSVGAVTKDIADNAKSTAKYFGGNVDALKKAAIQAAKMGMSIATMAKISDSLLNIESSLTAQFEFQAMTGRQINLDKARELSLSGDIAGAAQEVLGAVGSTAEFNKMNMLQRKKLAEAVGMEVDELQKSLIINEKLSDLTEEQKAAMTGLNLSAAELAKKTPAELKHLLAQNDALKKGEAAFDNIKSQMMTALIPLAETLGSLFTALTPVIKLISTALIPVSDTIKGVVGLVQNLVGLFTGTTEQLTTMQWILGTIAGIYLAIKGYALATQIIEGIKLGYQATSMGFEQRRALLEKQGLIRNIGIAVMKAYAMMGPLLGIAAGAGILALGYKFLNTGDLGMDSNGGPVVMSPSENTIFQGTKNDQVAMYPGAMDNALGGSSGGGSDPALINALMSKLDQLIAATKTPAPVQIGNRVITEIGNQLNADKSYRQGYNGAGGR